MGAPFYICFYHDKRTYRSSKKAYEEVQKMTRNNEDTKEGQGQFRVFFCPLTGGYHHTSITQAEMDRRQATGAGGNGIKGHQDFEKQRVRSQRNNGKRIKKQQRTWLRNNQG